MAQAKKKAPVVGTAPPKLRVQLSQTAHLQVSESGCYFGFFRTREASQGEAGVQKVDNAVTLTREEFERAIKEAAAAGLLTLPKSREVRLDELRTWIDNHPTLSAVISEEEAEEEEGGACLYISLESIVTPFEDIVALHTEAKRLFPDEKVYFQ